MCSSLRSIADILQRPKVLMILAVTAIAMHLLLITLFFTVNRSREPEILTADVTFNGTQRVVTFEKGSKVQELLYRTRNTFSDKNLDRVPPECLSLRKKGESKTLSNELKLYEDITVVATLASPEENQECDIADPFIRPHKIVPQTPYRLWNLASASLLQRVPNSPTNEVTCNGNFSDRDFNTVITTRLTGADIFAFIFEDNVNRKQFILNATNPNTITATEITSSPNIEESMKFETLYYWSFTVFKNQHYNTQYLGCGNYGKSILVPMEFTDYPNPRALFISNEYILI